MKQIKVKLKDCYGIKKLEYDFDFSNHRAVALYAPNDSMKSCFAKTFDDYRKDKPSGDQYRPEKPWSRNIVDETNTPLKKDAIIVINPYENDYETTEEVENLLIDKALKKTYTKVSKERDEAKKTFIKSLKDLSKSSKSVENLEKEISLAITPKEGQFFEALRRVKDKVLSQTEELFSDVEYDEIFNEEVTAFLISEDVKRDIENYITTYNKLLDKSTYFKRGIFNFYSAETIADALDKHGFFKATHTVNLSEMRIPVMSVRCSGGMPIAIP